MSPFTTVRKPCVKRSPDPSPEKKPEKPPARAAWGTLPSQVGAGAVDGSCLSNGGECGRE